MKLAQVTSSRPGSWANFMLSLQQCLAVAATLSLFAAIAFFLRQRGLRVVASACLFVASLTSVQLAVKALSNPPFEWEHSGILTTVHFACVWIGCAAYFVWTGEPGKIAPWSIGARRWMKNILPYALCMPISVVLNNVAIMNSGAGLVAIIGTLSPIVTALVSRFFGRKIACLSWFGVLLAMIGGAIISREEFKSAQASKDHRAVYGMVCALLAVLGRAMKIVISDWLFSPAAYGDDGKQEQLSFLHIYVLQFSAGDLVTLLFSLCMEQVGGFVKAYETLNGGILLMILVTCIPATILNFMGGVVLRSLGAPLQQLVGKLNTLVIAAIAMAFMGEKLSDRVLLGTAFVLAGVGVFEHGMNHQAQEEEEEEADEDEDNETSDEDGEEDGKSSREDTSASLPLLEQMGTVFAGRLSQIILATALWWSAAIYVTLMIKKTASSEDGKKVKLPPFTLTFLVNTLTGLVAWVLTMLLPCERTTSRPNELRVPEWVKIAVLGIMTGCEMGCLNKSLEFLSISERTFYQNANVLLTMILARLVRLETLTGLRIIAGLLLACGSVLQVLASTSQHEQATAVAQASHIQGMTFMVTSMLFTSGKWAMIQFLTQRSPPHSALGRMSKLQLAALVQPITGVICLFPAGFVEAKALLGVWHNSNILLTALVIALGITLIICAELKIVQLTSAVTCGVLVNLHHIPMVLSGVLLFGEKVQQESLYGLACCVLGGCVYVYARSTDPSTEDEKMQEPLYDRKVSDICA
mmetsp:Transcript_6225/g.14712  ORF Transcript_6225/g.14712 Transcript_6225/m.14712 type:complete len:753 (+) Transcript_6225:3-2261(+)